jgi:hypothetical protein
LLEFASQRNRAPISLSDPRNVVLLPGHRGPHADYNRIVYERMRVATNELTGDAFNNAYDAALSRIRLETVTPGTTLNGLATGSK